MLLSEAIRLGSMLNMQAWDQLEDEKSGGTCALGAAMQAFGIRTDQVTLKLQLNCKDCEENADNLCHMHHPKTAFELHFPDVDRPFNPTPFELARISTDRNTPMDCGPNTLYGYISCLNDGGYYSREWIADWLVESGNDIQSVCHNASTLVQVAVGLQEEWI